MFDAVLPLLNIGARVPVVGTIAHYNDAAQPSGPDRLPKLMTNVLQKRIRMQGLVILDHYGDRFEAFRRDIDEWVAAGRIKLPEDRVEGLSPISDHLRPDGGTRTASFARSQPSYEDALQGAGAGISSVFLPTG